MRKALPLILLGVGVFLLTQVLMPELAFKVWEIRTFQNQSPLVDPYSSSTQVLGISVEQVNNFPAFISKNLRTIQAPYREFKITVPSIKLFDIKVLVDSNDFEQNLGHLPGSALPGEKGNVFITGHSSLTQFFRSNNFNAIFANLPEVKVGDEIRVNALGQDFTYEVVGLKVVNPDDTWVINPPSLEGRYLTLMTCVPPGFNTKRLVVLAKLR
jgi:LPXTG-site transpeptidase (sortase) family protein